MDNPVRWFEIYVQDMGRAKTFYEAVFGIQLTKLVGGVRLEFIDISSGRGSSRRRTRV